MKMTYKVERNEQGKINAHYFVLTGKDNEQEKVEKVAEEMKKYFFVKHLPMGEVILMEDHFEGTFKTIKNFKDTVMEVYRKAKDTVKNNIAVKRVKKHHARRKNVVKAILLAGTYTHNKAILATYSRLDYGTLTYGQKVA